VNDTASASPSSPQSTAKLPSPLADSKLSLGWIYAIPILIALAVFAQILGAGWVYDDVLLIQSNERMHDWSTIGFTFQNPFWDLSPYQENYTGFYRPIGGAMFVLLFKIGSGSPVIFHLASLLFHAACTALVVRLGLVVGLPRIAALLAGSYFALSGSHVEAVAWASSLPDLLATFFSLLAMLGFLRFKLVMPAIWLILAIISKEAALSTWLVLVAATLFSLPKLPQLLPGASTTVPARTPRFVMLLAVALVVWLLRWQAFDSPAAGFDKQLTFHYLKPLHQAMLSLGLIFEYIAYFVWPWPNFPFRPLQVDLTPADAALWGPAAAGLVVLLGSALVWLMNNRRSALVLIGFGLLFAGLAPVLDTKVIGRFPFEQRFLYLPSVGFSLLFGYGILWFGHRSIRALAALPLETGRRFHYLPTIGFSLLIGYSLLLICRQLPKLNEALPAGFGQDFLYLPSIGFSLLIGFALLWLGRRKPRAVAPIPAVILAVSNVWSTVDATPRWKDEYAFFTWTRTESPNAMTPYLNLARLYLTEAESYPPGHPQRVVYAEKAFDEYEASLKVDSDKWLVTSIERENGNFGMGQALFTMGDLSTAEAVYRETLKGYPNSIHAHVGIAQCLLMRVEQQALSKPYQQLIPLWEEALVHANKAIGGIQELPDAYHCKSVSLYMLRRPKEALEPARLAFALKPSHYPYVMNLAEILTVERRFKEMRDILVQHLEASPESQFRAEVEETINGLNQMLPPG
jgi:tetratricopeptide (TPR) repeat protein